MPTQANRNATEIAIIGMSGRFPSAANKEEFWENLAQGRSGIKPVTPNLASRLPGDPNYVAKAATVEEADKFDATFFGIYPKQAQEMDPQHRLFLEEAWSALEDSGYRPDTTEAIVGVFAGCHMNTYIFQRLAADRILRENLADSFPGGNLPAEIANDKDYLATRVAFHLNLRGPCVAVQTACSTSLVAVAQACESIASGACDMALAGGVTVTFPQDQGYLHTEDSIISPDGVCRTFDADAKGTVFGDGVGAVLLKRLDDAVNDGDSIYAVIKGWGVNNDGSDKGGYTAPSIAGQRGAIERAHKRAGISAESITYVEAHGTGTLVGDPIEVAALTEAFRQTTDKKQYCAIGSLKSNVGHLDVAAGVTAVVKTAMALKHRQIPPSLNFSKPNPRIDFESSPFFVQTELTDWPQLELAGEKVPRRAGISSFGVGGTNAHLVLEEAPSLVDEKTENLEPQILCISAHGDKSLEEMREDLEQHLRSNSDLNLADVSHTLMTGRKPLAKRVSVVAITNEKAGAALLDKTIKPSTASLPAEPTLVFMFPGQGSQHTGMAQSLYEEDQSFAKHVDLAADALSSHVGLDLRPLIFRQSGTPAADINATAYAQPSIFLIAYALAKWLEDKGIRTDLLIGHSAGEFAAAAIAGIMSLEDAAKLVAARGRLMQKLPAGSMLAVNLSEQVLMEILPPGLELAAINAPRLSVASGPTELIDRFAADIEQGKYGEDTIGRLLKTSHAFHSAMMDPAVTQFREVVQQVKLQAPQMPMVSSVTTEELTDETATSLEYWTRQIREPVRFSDSLGKLLSSKDLVFLEVGPGQSLSTLARQQPLTAPGQRVISTLPHVKQDVSSRQHVLEAIGKLWQAGVTLQPEAWHRADNRRRVHLPTYRFDRKRHWFEVTKSPEQSAQASSPTNGRNNGEAIRPVSTNGQSVTDRLPENFTGQMVRQHMQIMQQQLDLLSRQNPK